MTEHTRRRPRTLQGRLVLVFGAATLVLCVLAGVVAIAQFRSQLRASLDEGLSGRYAVLQRQVSAPPNGQGFVPLLPDTESFAQVISADGNVLAASPRVLRNRPVLDDAQLAAAIRGKRTLVRSIPPKAQRARLLAGPGRLGSQRVVLVVGTSLDDTTRAEQRLELTLAVGLPVLAIIVAAGGWFLAGGALAPVRSMVEEADAISAAQVASGTGSGPGRRLSVPTGGEELAELARRLNALLDRIERSVAHERAFLDDASHELRTPISIARGEAELARMSVDDHTEAAIAIDSLVEEIDRLDHLARNLLVLARTRAAAPASWPEVDLADVARRAVDAVERAGGSDGVRIHVEGEAIVRGDESGLERALSNLVQNAVRVARREVDVRITTHDDLASVEVADDGPGFPPELLPRAFERFTHEPPGDGREGGNGASPPRAGAGLGLAIVAAIAAAHGGRATATNTGHGASVCLSLPRRPA